MKQHRLLAVAIVAALASTVAVAQTAPKPRMAIDTNGDGVIDRAEAAKFPRLAARFDQLDQNKDGRLTADERPRPKAGKRGGHLQALDANKDGRISLAEAQAAPGGKLAGRFAQMDVNKDGYLDRADRQLKMQQQRAAFFAGADANRDGRLTRDEFVVEQGARAAERRAQWQQRAAAAGRQVPARPAPTQAEQVQRAGAMFDRIDANKDGVVTRAEYDAFKPMAGRKHRKG